MSASGSAGAVNTLARSALHDVRLALAGPSGAALRRGSLGALLVTLGGFSAGAVPVDGGPASVLGVPWLLTGHGIALGLIVTWTGVALLVTSWLALGPRAVAGRLPTSDALTAVALWTLPLVPAAPVFSRDVWSYLAQGAMTAAGVDPYTFGPDALPGTHADQVSPDWKSTPTPYGPVHLLVMSAITSFSGGSSAVAVLTLRLLTLVALAGLCAALESVSHRTGTDAGFALWCGAASPLVVIHLVGGLHNETLPLVGAVAACALALAGHRWSATGVIGLAMAFKITAVLIAPFLLWLLWSSRRGGTGRRPRGAALLDILAVTAVPVGVVALASALGPGFGWVGGLAVSDRVINYLSVPTGLAHLVALSVDPSGPGFDAILAATRAGGRVILIALLVTAWVVHRHPARRVFTGLVVVLVAFVTLNSVAWPWYHVWPAAFWAMAAPTRAATACGVGGTIFLVLALGPNGSTSLYSAPVAVAGAAGALAAAAWWMWATRVTGTAVRGQVRTPSPVPGA